MAIEAHATAKYVRTSAQKAGLVMDLIRGRDVNHALATLKFARKGIARDIEKVLRSAIANAQQKDGFGGDVDRLFVTACYANQGPSQKRIRPAPMGRAFRVVKRTAHLTVRVAERAPRVVAASASAKASAGQASAPAGEPTPTPRPKRAGAKPKAKPRAKAASAAKPKSPTKRGGAAKKAKS
ncbi:MAG: 50S ribosomal protein L22 [Acidobacteria bacterium]|nr:MAG: 50S ribosomal protein L22 [Acidobacteriota bacterium]